jgi:hypothetical protein
MTEKTKKEKISNSLSKLKNKESKILFVVADSETPNASTYEIYRHANVLKNNGYDVTLLTENESYIIPAWLDNELKDVKHVSIEKNKLSVSPEDLLVIPEVFSNVMEQTKNLPCMRIGLLQSMDYMLKALVPGTDWSTFGLFNVITTNNSLTNYFNEFTNNKFNVKTIKPAVPDYFFNISEIKKPIISIVGRNPNEISKVVKLFYSKYPQYNWITFDTMLTESNPPQQISRKDYAEKFSQNLAVVWLDRIASFGTVAVEAMASGCIPIGITPDITPDYLLTTSGDTVINNEFAGYWSSNVYDIPLFLNQVIIESFDDRYDDDYLVNMQKIAETYKASNIVEETLETYEDFINQRIGVLENALKEIELNEEKLEETSNNENNLQTKEKSE